ncbi:MAG: serine/threonine protein kinase, partial [Cyanobacteria bacterium]|nr:serine/threonine protein kinase [Cyanobacteriota bacterium]
MPVTRGGSGSLTQWMLICNCGRDLSTGSAEAPPIDICGACGKRLRAGRSGTLTQWIFRADLCSCDNPIAQFLPPGTTRGSFEQEQQEEETLVESEITVDATSFPVDRYAPLRLLGSGASGTVYLCRDRMLAKRVAVKVLNHLSGEELIAFQNEAKATCQLNHPNIVKVLDFGIVDLRSPYMVLEYLPGASLEKLLERGPMDPDTALGIFEQICDALSYLHSRGLFHRDLKPSNVIVSTTSGEPVAKVIDFSIGTFKGRPDARPSRGSYVGTPAYMSPEQSQGATSETTSEVYTFGCVLFEALTGYPPYIGQTAVETISMHTSEPVPSLQHHLRGSVRSVPSLENLVSTCLAKAKEERYQNFEEVKRALQEAMQELQDASEVPSTSTAGKRSVIFPVLFSLLFIASTAFGAMYFQSSTASRKPSASTRKASPVNVPKLKDAIETVDSFKWRRGIDSTGLEGWVSGASVTDEDFKLLQDKPDVTFIYVTFNDAVTGDGLKYLLDRPIKGVSFQCSSLSDEALLWMSKIKSMQSIRLSLSSMITIAGLKHLTTLPKLRQLDLCVTRLPSGALDVIAKIKSLRLLSFYNSQGVSLEGLKKVALLQDLHFLDLTGT